MKLQFVKYLLLFICLTTHIGATNINQFDFQELPVLYQGRFRPVKAYTILSQLDLFHKSPKEEMLWNLFVSGHSSFDKQSLFKIDSSAFKTALGLSSKTTLFNYEEINQALFQRAETNLAVMRHLIPKIYRDAQSNNKSTSIELTSLSQGLWVKQQGKNILVMSAPKQAPWQHLTEGLILNAGESIDPQIADEALDLFKRLDRYAKFGQERQSLAPIIQTLQNNHLTSQEITLFLEEKFPLLSRVLESGNEFQMLPLKTPKGTWVSLTALGLQVFDSETGLLKPIPNFTLYSDSIFKNIQEAYLTNDLQKLANGLGEGYSSIENTIYRKGSDKQLSYPSLQHLRAESFYYSFPLLEWTVFFYASSIFCFFLAYFLKNTRVTKIALGGTILGLICHTSLLALRCYILQRPPVSNMFETVLYVPWIAVLSSFFFYQFFRNYVMMVGSCLVAIPLLVLLSTTRMNIGLENVQAVLDSQYWLIIHVLMIVGSYSFFLLCGILGHLSLYAYSFQFTNRDWAKKLEPLILNSMYVGTALLIPGTLLGGVWAAESWGRFWDWDPKESWAFISSCVYIFWIHLHRFNHIGGFGLAFGSIVGMQSIIFTWYGVNYILGTGLHSYGFGSGGNFYYFLFVVIDFCVLGAAALRYMQLKSRTLKSF